MNEEDIDMKIIEEKDNDDLIPVLNKTIYAKQADESVETLYNRYKNSRILIQPDFQRKYVWDKTKASLLIESILLGVPIPMIYFAETPNNKLNVIDGQQRLTSLFSFKDEKFPDGKEFKLNGLKVFTELNGKTFSKLSESEINKINEYAIRTITFSSSSDPNLQYEIFSRLNTGSVALNTQELRNCIYRGEFNDFIKELANDKDYLSITGFTKKACNRMKNVEYVLRFVSFYKKTYINYKNNIKSFLNNTMEQYKNGITEKEKKEIKEAFKNAVKNVKSLLGEKCFVRYLIGTEKNKNGGFEAKNTFNASLFDVLMDSMARQDTTVIMRHLDSIREAYINLMGLNEDFIRTIEKATSDKKSITKRFELWSSTLNDVLQDDILPDTRCFSRELKEKLYNENPKCSICGQHISCIDDSAVDHIEQYWKGGKTIPENARLAHRFCNSSRSKYN